MRVINEGDGESLVMSMTVAWVVADRAFYNVVPVSFYDREN